MKKQLLFLMTFFLLACSHEKDNTYQKKSKASNSLIEESPIKKIAQEKTILPDGITLDTLLTTDESKSLIIEIVLPRLKNQANYFVDELLTNIINKEKSKFIKSVDRTIKEDGGLPETSTTNRFRAWPEEIYKKDSIISYLFVIEICHAGAAHPKMDYYSFNYDIGRKKQISFADYFILETSLDSNSLLQKTNAFFDNEFIKADSIYDFDFSFNEDFVSFNFDDYEIASYSDGMQRATFDKKNLDKYINKRYRE